MMYHILFTFFSITCGEHIQNVTLETEVNLGFFGNLSLADSRNHNKIVMCEIYSPHTTNPWKKYDIDKIDPFLCSHITFSDYQINKMGNGFVINNGFNDTNSQWLLKLKLLKSRNPELKLIPYIYADEMVKNVMKDKNPFTFGGIGKSIFFPMLIDFLRTNGLDGIAVDGTGMPLNFIIYLSKFLCMIGDYLSRRYYQIGVKLPAGKTGSHKWIFFNEMETCVDFFVLKTAFPSPEMHRSIYHPYNLYQFEGDNAQSIEAAFEQFTSSGISPKKIILSVENYGQPFTLLNPSNGRDCCHVGEYSDNAANFPELGERGMLRFSLMANEICKLHSNFSKWKIYRTNPGKEVYMTDGARWVAYEDNLSLAEKVKFAIRKDLLGFAVLSFADDNYQQEPCKNSTQGTNTSFAFTHQLNYLIHRFTQNVSEISSEVLKDNGTLSLEECALIADLWEAGIPENDYSKWTCVAKEESQFENRKVELGKKPLDENGCSTEKYGIFGLSSPICRSNNSNPKSCLKSVCDSNCEDLIGNNSRSIACLDIASGSPWFLTPPSWEFCYDKPTNHWKFEEGMCENMPALKSLKIPIDYLQENNDYITGIILILTIGGILILAVALAAVLRNKSKTTELSYEEIKLFKYGIDLGNTGIPLNFRGDIGNPNDGPFDPNFEVHMEDYSIDKKDVFGSGAYGVVYKALVRNRPTAAKTLKPFAEKRFLLALLMEVKVMSYLGRHDNIVEFIGADIDFLKQGILYIFVELCALGSLDKFLQGYYQNAKEEDKSYIKSDFMLWGIQIASGMLYLSSKKVVHGDLSAKNVLLTVDKIAKISDFGLSRKLYDCPNYTKKTKEMLPWRWMSIEALRELQFSTKSDVWAFGVTMWEICSLGSIPYPGVLTYSSDFLKKLVTGELRPERFNNSFDSIYNLIMLPTWNDKPDLRPSFEVLALTLQGLREKEVESDYAVVEPEKTNQNYYKANVK